MESILRQTKGSTRNDRSAGNLNTLQVVRAEAESSSRSEFVVRARNLLQENGANAASPRGSHTTLPWDVLLPYRH
jgi:hypothetical protein